MLVRPFAFFALRGRQFFSTAKAQRTLRTKNKGCKLWAGNGLDAVLPRQEWFMGGSIGRAETKRSGVKFRGLKAGFWRKVLHRNS